MILLLACTVEQTVITPPADTIVETVTVYDTHTPCEATGALAVDTSALTWSWWQGEEVPSTTRTVEVLAEPCEGFVAQSSEAWLAASIEGTELTITADPWAVPSGRHAATVTLHDLDSAQILERIDVDLDVRRVPDEVGRRNVLVLAVDGYDAAVTGETPTLDRLAAAGARATSTTQTADLTSCGPGWAAVLTGSEDHGVWTDGVALDTDPFADLDHRVWIGAEWEGFSDLVEPDATEAVTDEAIGALRSGLAQVHLVQLHGLDEAGHEAGFTDNATYQAALVEIDQDVDRLVDSLLDRPEIASEDWLIVLTSDHGGDAWGSHGTLAEDYQSVPLILSHPRLATKRLEGASHLDVAPTMRSYVGIDPAAYVGTDWWGFERSCADGVDDDEDGLVDCDDSDCADTLECNTCPDETVSGSGAIELPESWHDWIDSSCGTGGDELLLSWRAPSEGAWTFVGETVAVLDGDCLAEELACGSAATTTLSEGQEITLYVEGSELHVLEPPACTDENLGSGDVSPTWTRSGEAGMAGDCGVLYNARTFSWVADSDGYWIFHTYGSDGDTILYALDECGGDVTVCTDNGWGDDAWTYEALNAGASRVFVVGSADGSLGDVELSIYKY